MDAFPCVVVIGNLSSLHLGGYLFSGYLFSQWQLPKDGNQNMLSIAGNVSTVKIGRDTTF